MFKKVLVANRGAIACRIIRTLQGMDIASVAVYSEADRNALHVRKAGEAMLIGPAQASKSYLSVEKILQAARQTGAQAIHPGYGFLSENAGFAEACRSEGIAFIGPRPEHIRAFGLKHTARQLAFECGIPMLPGTGLLSGLYEALHQADQIGYPVMLKSTAGGGGIGMRLCASPEDLISHYEAVERLSEANFKNSGIYIEKFVQQARHIEVQVFGDGKGNVIALGERDCSTQRRNQKVIEETPAPGVTDATRDQLFDSAVRLATRVQYESAGTVEFLFDGETGEFYFLEVNTRLQVEHGVTEEVTGVDLVEWMVRQAAGDLAPLGSIEPKARGCAIQVRLYAENPARDFQPCAGLLTQVSLPTEARVDGWVETGTEVSPYYDPLLAKLIVRAETREQAVHKLREALRTSRLEGLETNLDYLRSITADPLFQSGGITTAYLKSFVYQPHAIEVIEPGMQTTLQDYPGRLGYWDVGVPPSGPMDAFAFRISNRLVGNPEDAVAMEITINGPTLRFLCDSEFALTGASMDATLDGTKVSRWCTQRANAGALLRIGGLSSGGSRAYLAVRGGFQATEFLGSRGTFLLGKFGGHAGRALRPGDMLRFNETAPLGDSRALAEDCVPHYGATWEIGVLYGPHGAPEFFANEDIDTFFSTTWKTHYNSDRTGIRLIGPKPKWARADGGEAGLHPSNIHDNAYAVGTVDFTGDMPVILGPDGPSLGGFVCPATIVSAERWKMGQLHSGDMVRFRRLSLAEAEAMEAGVEGTIRTLRTPPPELPRSVAREPAVLSRKEASAQSPAIVLRADGDKYLLLEYGPNVLDMNLRFRIHALVGEIRKLQPRGIIDITPGIRSVQIHYENRLLPRADLMAMLETAEAAIPDLDHITVPSRVVQLPLSWDDPATQLAIRKYMQGVRADAPWCPSNIEFIRRINGLGSIDDVHRIVFDANHLVLGLGDVYLGAPVATPTDPRHRLVTTKYNPARTWTPENAVGIGGAYMCVYGMEGPGGYQFVGRTVQMWNTHRTTADFLPGSPWLLRFFDQIRFYPVSAQELLELREDFPHGRFRLRTEETQFSLRDHHAFLASINDSAAAFKATQQQAFQEERERWAKLAPVEFMETPTSEDPTKSDEELPQGCEAVRSPITASVWNVAVEPGQVVQAGQRLVVLEAMKMEVSVSAPAAGKVEELRCREGAFVTAGQHLVVIRPLLEAA
ncbi:MAG: urea carboxylase [Acidobacteria bacterium]|nr:urea carboxylase [Acidobacteriota bacterium]